MSKSSRFTSLFASKPTFKSIAINWSQFFVRQVQIFKLAFKGFNEDKVQLRASGLTYYTMLSLVPIVAMFFGIAKGFGFEARLENQLKENLEGQEEVLEWVIGFAEKYLAKIQGGLIAGIGVIVLLWSVMKLLSNIESSFNDIWQIKKARVMSRKISDYISLVVIAPIMVFVSSSVNVFLNKQVDNSSEVFPLLGYLGPFLNFIVSIVLPFALIWLVFTLLYVIMPNTKVNFKSAFIGGIIAGTMFQLMQWLYIYFQSSLSGYGAVYGSFAALPLFLIWLQTSWLIVLFGAEVSFANQNIGHYEAEADNYTISHHHKQSVTLMLVKLIAQNFRDGIPPMTAENIANKLDLSVRLVRDILYELQDIGIVTEAVTKNIKESAYQPGRDLSLLKTADLLKGLNKHGSDNTFSENSNELKKIEKLLDGLSGELDKSQLNKTILDI